MLDTEELNSIKHSLYNDDGKGKIELADKIELLILKEENKEELIKEIKNKLELPLPEGRRFLTENS